MKKQWIKISDLLSFQEGPGVRNTQYTTSGVKLLNVANLVDGKVDLSTSERYISEEEAYGKYKHFLCDKGDFVVASSGIKVEYIDKKMGFIDESMLPLCMNTSTIRFKVLDPSTLRIRYFMYYLKSQSFKEQLTRYITGSAQLNYGPSHIKQMVMPWIPLESQDKLIERLDRVQVIIEHKEQQLTCLDKLVKSRFIELFGTGHDGKCATAKIGNVCKFQQGTQIPVEMQIEEPRDGYRRFLRIIDYTQAPQPPRFVAVEGKAVDEKSVVIVRYGATAGFVGRGYRGILANNLFEVIPDENLVSKDFLYLALKHGTFERDIHEKAFGAAMPALSFAMMNDIPVVTPSHHEQAQFVTFVEQTDKSKLAVKQSLEKLETLKKSLMQQYFG